MSYDEFVDLVCQMRIKQKEYFTTRSQIALVSCKVLEKKVDDAIIAFAKEGGAK